jgi:hypothetical protein
MAHSEFKTFDEESRYNLLKASKIETKFEHIIDMGIPAYTCSNVQDGFTVCKTQGTRDHQEDTGGVFYPEGDSFDMSLSDSVRGDFYRKVLKRTFHELDAFTIYELKKKYADDTIFYDTDLEQYFILHGDIFVNLTENGIDKYICKQDTTDQKISKLLMLNSVQNLF